MNISLLLVAFAVFKASLVSSQATNMRGTLVSCKSNADCAVTCTERPCPPKKDCLNGFCRNPKNFETCGPKKLCNKLKGEACCDADCGICGSKKGNSTMCPMIACIKPDTPIVSPTKTSILEKCGNTICKAGTTCCNASCGTCVPKGGSCTQQVCNPDPVIDVTPIPDATVRAIKGGGMCGTAFCGKGQYCCNPSCSTCAPFGASCTMQVCDQSV